MRKTAIEKTKEELEAEERNQPIDDEHWFLDMPDSFKSKSTDSVVVEQSCIIFSGIQFGRMSFNGFNPLIEKLMNPPEVEEAESDNEKEIDDEEMAYNLNKKFSKNFNKSNDALKRTQAFMGKVKRLGHK